MKAESTVHAGADRNWEPFPGALAALAAAATLLLELAPAHAADQGGVGKTPVVTLESIPGSTVPRVILTPRSAERLGIATSTVSEELVVRRQMVSGLVIPPLEKQSRPSPASGAVAGFGAAPAPRPASGGFADFGRIARRRRHRSRSRHARARPPSARSGCS
jgi:hypothetical protein